MFGVMVMVRVNTTRNINPAHNPNSQNELLKVITNQE